MRKKGKKSVVVNKKNYRKPEFIEYKKDLILIAHSIENENIDVERKIQSRKKGKKNVMKNLWNMRQETS